MKKLATFDAIHDPHSLLLKFIYSFLQGVHRDAYKSKLYLRYKKSLEFIHQYLNFFIDVEHFILKKILQSFQQIMP